MTGIESNKGITYTKVKLQELTEKEIKERKIEKKELEKYEFEKNREHKTTKTVPEGFVFKWMPPYGLDEQITLFNSKQWFTNSFKTTPKPYWSGDFNNPYYTYRTDLEVQYLRDQLEEANTEKGKFAQAIKALETEIAKDPDNKGELEEILATFKNPEWQELFTKLGITDTDDKQTWKKSGLSPKRPHRTVMSEIERAIKNDWDEPDKITDKKIKEYESHGAKTPDIDVCKVVKSELDKVHRIIKEIEEVDKLDNIDSNFAESRLRALDKSKLPWQYPALIRIIRSNKISNLRGDENNLINIRDNLSETILKGLGKYHDPKYKFAQIVQDWQQFGINQGQWGNIHRETWLDYISLIDEEGTHPLIGSKIIEENIKGTFSKFIFYHLLNYPYFTIEQRKEYLQEWVNDNKTEKWDVELLSIPEIRERLTEPKYKLEIKDLPDAVEVKKPKWGEFGGGYDEEEKEWDKIDEFKWVKDLIDSWKDRGFTAKQTKEWLDVGLETGEYELAEWIRDNKGKDAKWLEEEGDKDELEKEFRKSKPFTEKPKEEGETDLDKKKKKLYNYLLETSEKYKLESRKDSEGRSIDEHGKKIGHYHNNQSTWAKEITEIEEEGSDEGQFEDVKNSLLNSFAEFFINSIFGDIGLPDDDEGSEKGRKTLIREYMAEHRDPNEWAIYNQESSENEKNYKKKITEDLGLTIPDSVKLEI